MTTPTRVIEVDPERLDRWLAGFADRHGATPTPPRSHAAAASPARHAADGSTVVATPFAHDPLGVVLVRRGGYAVALASGATFTASKVGSRHVQSRTAAGGWSQQRFARRRGKQADELVDAVVGIRVGSSSATTSRRAREHPAYPGVSSSGEPHPRPGGARRHRRYARCARFRRASSTTCPTRGATCSRRPSAAAAPSASPSPSQPPLPPSRRPARSWAPGQSRAHFAPDRVSSSGHFASLPPSSGHFPPSGRRRQSAHSTGRGGWGVR